MNVENSRAGKATMLHIHNGESSAQTLRQTEVPGLSFSFSDALIAGPAPAGLDAEEWRKVRARHLSESYGVHLEECQRRLLKQEGTLASFSAHEEIVLWFEHDLFCQVNMLYLLDWFAVRDLRKTKLSLICVGEFPGIENFSGLGQLDTRQLASLYDSRHEVTRAEKELGRAAWEAYCSPDPRAIEKILSDDTSALPYLRGALRCHLARFPSVKNGLGRIENQGLELVHDGFRDFAQLFPKFQDAEPVYGLGDFQFYLAMKELSDAREPLMVAKDGNSHGALDSKQIRKTHFEPTQQGEAVLQGNADFVQMNGIDLWLGGVHLSDTDLWRWDERSQRLAR